MARTKQTATQSIDHPADGCRRTGRMFLDLAAMVFGLTLILGAGDPSSDATPGAGPEALVAAADETPMLAASVPDRAAAVRIKPSEDGSPPVSEADEPITRALKAIADCRERYRAIQDYRCTFYKRERVDGRLTPTHVMSMKARTKPSSIYFKFISPTPGREAIYVAGRNAGRVLAHDVGLGKLVAGTLNLDPRGSRAMDQCRHPITEAGIGPLIETVAKHWALEMKPGETRVVFTEGVKVGQEICTMIESTHPSRHPSYQFHKVLLYISREHGLPIRFEAYDWPKKAGAAPELMEEYTYHNLRTNVGLRDLDFDPANEQYAFGRF